MQHVIPCLVCTLIVGFFIWTTDSTAPLDATSPRAPDSYYNLLVQGFSEGHLYVKRDPPDALARLANPYNPAVSAPYLKALNDLSYYKGKLYLYFGVTPALVLFWPWHILTGQYLSEGGAVAIFFTIGFAAFLGLTRAMAKRYFPETNIWMVTASMLVLGLAMGLMISGSVYEQTGLTVSGSVYDIAETSGFAFAMLALAAIWRATDAGPARKALWLSLASFAYGLAIGSRPTLLFGAVVLLAPVIQAWRDRAGSGQLSRVIILIAAAVVPIALVGMGLMLYNDLRFGNPLEFGWHYQLNQNDQASVRQFSAHYLWFDFRFYFLQPFGLSAHFPFLKSVPLPPVPLGHYARVTSACGAILTSFPLLLLALAVPLLWRGRPAQTVSPLRCFAVALLSLLTAVSLTLCLFFATNGRYALDFLPELLLLSIIGFLCVERALPYRPWGILLRSGWCLLAMYSLMFCVLLNVETHAKVDCLEGRIFFRNNRLDDALAKYQKAEVSWPDYGDAHYGAAITLEKLARPDGAIAEYQKALQIEPDYALAHENLADCFLEQGQTSKAVEQWKLALQYMPGMVSVQVNLSWVMATCPDASVRDGPIAVALAERARQLSNGRNPLALRSLAAAYAEIGQYTNAVAAAQQAFQFSHDNPGMAAVIQDQLKHYQNHQPYRDQALAPRDASTPQRFDASTNSLP
ncbi:MAG TPA: tetratricopeptide repeat protein [Candidatus Acidoferrales bacterium]|nr:tetratricopeptide repeat protein [Candidatus Acidoferrales bacterium]